MRIITKKSQEIINQWLPELVVSATY